MQAAPLDPLEPQAAPLPHEQHAAPLPHEPQAAPVGPPQAAPLGAHETDVLAAVLGPLELLLRLELAAAPCRVLVGAGTAAGAGVKGVLAAAVPAIS